ncbi:MULTISPECIES: putative lipid II flippase FtsW [Nocardiopsis]|uniref:Probable peptidoglycan glycosyltransferase FtsW n=2 Tax=Nocardiopsis alba TaxID=53437 RepID=A0A7K2IWZ7_9ACTN|nr:MULTISPECIES: putative lipid II flippase FtsW [Nocardiopsis]AFR08385.1 cell division protein FtsW [Nocardiopsis alba ATCC BAA-2165]MEC3892179.1 putative lipid II flippase FtsW [Nocardiopsis sp. LDBS1602]MYR34453.1 putative lipid II flippase FtsW [Nocardiopsis alba]
MAATTAVPSTARSRGRTASGGRERALWREWARSLDRPLTSYYLILGTGMMLIALGLVMVLSSTMVNSISETGSAFSVFQRQLVSATIGLPLMIIASQLPLWVFRLVGYPAMILSVALLLLTAFQGTEVNGAIRWLEIGGLLIQPSEPAKLAFVLWGSNILARKEELKELTEWRHLLIPLLPGCGLLTLLVLLGSDLSTTLVLLVVFLSLLWVVGAPGKLFVGMFGLVLGLAAIVIAIEPFRLRRITAFLDPGADPTGSGFQSLHGLYALGTGGIFGVGIGASREKWGFLPYAESDFIFAIIGEEFGLIGTLVVLGLFGMLGYAGLRVAFRVKDPFSRLAAFAIVTWIIGQSMINIAAVIGLVPVTGIPLPLVSYGGSSLIPTMIGLGVLLAIARNEPQAQKALAARGPSWVQRALSWLGLEKFAASVQNRGGGAPSRRTTAPSVPRTARERGTKTTAKHKSGPVPVGDRPRRNRRR